MKTLPRYQLLNVPFHSLSLQETVMELEKAIDERRPIQHCVINAAKVVKAQKDKGLLATISSSDIISVDGQAVVWAARSLGIPVPERVAGIDLMWQLLKLANERRYRICFLGATDEVLTKMSERVHKTFPLLSIVRTHNGYFSTKDEPRIIDIIRETKADMLFVGMPTPKKEAFIHTHFVHLNIPVVIGVGGSFDVLAGTVKRAPKWMQDAGLEWSFRLAQEPVRLFWRYASTNTRFVLLIVRELWKDQMEKRFRQRKLAPSECGK